MNVSGHRLSTIEIENALVSHPTVAEAAVVGRADPMTGQAIAAFVTLKNGVTGNDQLIQTLRNHVAGEIGKFARPASIVLMDSLPKTGSGKIMRRLLRDISEKRALGDVTTLTNPEVMSDINASARQPTPKEDPLDPLFTWLQRPKDMHTPTPARCLICDSDMCPTATDIHVLGHNCPECMRREHAIKA